MPPLRGPATPSTTLERPHADEEQVPSILEMRQVTKVYPNGLLANDRVDFSVEPGEVHALVGENGAGKTTLMKILYGMEPCTEGQIWIQGRRCHIANPLQAIRHGIGMVHQHFMLVGSFTVAQNVVLGMEPGRPWLIDNRQSITATLQRCKEYGLKVDPTSRIESIPVGMRQQVEILKALHRGARILVLDEPTAVLTPQETAQLFVAIREMARLGKTVIFITHKLREVKEVSDRVTVMRAGRVMGTMPTGQVGEREIARLMIGRDVFLEGHKPAKNRGERILEVRNLSGNGSSGRQAVRDVSFAVRAGEILCVAGVEGNGQSELVEMITGLRQASAGLVTVVGHSVLNRNPRVVREAGVAHIPEDRLGNGLAMKATVQDNLIVDRYYRPPLGGVLGLNARLATKVAEELVEEFDIRVDGVALPVHQLSGGNMQKVVVARELSSHPRVLVACQPTRGIDVANAEYVRTRIVQERELGAAVLLVSADLGEVMSLADRIVVMYGGEIVAMFQDVARVNEKELGLYMLGVKRQSSEEMEAWL